jgi:hypothetical protein
MPQIDERVDYYSDLHFDIQMLIKDLTRSLPDELPKFEKMFQDKGIKLHEYHYIMWNNILNMDSVPYERILDTISYFVKSKNFQYSPENNPEGFVETLAATTWWLRGAHGMPDAYKYTTKSKDYEERIVAQYFDIGVTLINKGFNFRIPPEDWGDNIMVGSAAAYLRQCRKRRIYLARGRVKPQIKI